MSAEKGIDQVAIFFTEAVQQTLGLYGREPHDLLDDMQLPYAVHPRNEIIGLSRIGNVWFLNPVHHFGPRQFLVSVKGNEFRRVITNSNLASCAVVARLLPDLFSAATRACIDTKGAFHTQTRGLILKEIQEAPFGVFPTNMNPGLDNPTMLACIFTNFRAAMEERNYVIEHLCEILQNKEDTLFDGRQNPNNEYHWNPMV